MLYRLTKWTVGLSTFFVALLVAGSTAFAGVPTDFIKANAQQVSDLLETESSEERSKKFSEKLHSLVDFRELADRALETHWDKRTDEEKEQFLSLLQELLEANYRKKLEGRALGEDYEIDYLEEKMRGNKAIVKTKVNWEDGEETVDYKMLDSDEGWIIYDIVIDDISLVETYRDSYTKIIEEDGWGELIDRMEKKAEKIRKEAKTAEKEE